MADRPHFGFVRRTLISAGTVLAILLAGCANQAAFTDADHANCRKLGFDPGGEHYYMCLSEVQRRQTALAAAPEPLREDYTAAVPTAPAQRKAISSETAALEQRESGHPCNAATVNRAGGACDGWDPL
jgi:hypothetical protein